MKNKNLLKEQEIKQDIKNSKPFHIGKTCVVDLNLEGICTYANALQKYAPERLEAEKENLLIVTHSTYIKENNLKECDFVFSDKLSSDVAGTGNGKQLTINSQYLKKYNFFQLLALIVHEQEHIDQLNYNPNLYNSSVEKVRKQYVSNQYSFQIAFESFLNSFLSCYELNGHEENEDMEDYYKLLVLKNDYNIAINQTYGNQPWELEARRKELNFLKYLTNLLPDNKEILKFFIKQQTWDAMEINAYNNYSFYDLKNRFYAPAINIAKNTKNAGRLAIEEINAFENYLNKFEENMQKQLKTKNDVQYCKTLKANRRNKIIFATKMDSKKLQEFEFNRITQSENSKFTSELMGVRKERMDLGNKLLKERKMDLKNNSLFIEQTELEK